MPHVPRKNYLSYITFKLSMKNIILVLLCFIDSQFLFLEVIDLIWMLFLNSNWIFLRQNLSIFFFNITLYSPYFSLTSFFLQMAYFEKKIGSEQARSLLFISILILIFSIACTVVTSLIKKEHSDVANDIFVVWAAAPVSSTF